MPCGADSAFVAQSLDAYGWADEQDLAPFMEAHDVYGEIWQLYDHDPTVRESRCLAATSVSCLNHGAAATVAATVSRSSAFTSEHLATVKVAPLEPHAEGCPKSVRDRTSRRSVAISSRRGRRIWIGPSRNCFGALKMRHASSCRSADRGQCSVPSGTIRHAEAPRASYGLTIVSTQTRLTRDRSGGRNGEHSPARRRPTRAAA